MKTAILPFAIAILASFTAMAGGGKHLFILSGQSNMAGLNPAISFTPAVHEAFGPENCIVIKDAQAGSRSAAGTRTGSRPRARRNRRPVISTTG